MEEEPEIDIEENPLRYPRIESIYSDVTIKAEPIDIDEDGYDSMDISASSEYYMPIPNKIILGSKPSTSVLSEPIPGPSTAADDWEDQDNFFECAQCNLLFPTQNELDSHKMSTHSFLVARPLSRAIKFERRISVSSNTSTSHIEDISSQDNMVRRQKAVKSTAKSSLNKTFPMLHDALTNNNPYGYMTTVSVGQNDTTDMGDKLLCKHCDVRFPDLIALIKHTYELLPETSLQCNICQKTFDSKPALSGHRARHFRKTGSPPKKSLSLLQCIYCSCYLMYPGFMKAHLLKNHKVSEYAVKPVSKYSGKCAICSKPIKDYKLYNKHLLKYHRKVFMSKTPYRFDVAPVKMKCLICSQIFTSRYAASKHKAEKHPELNQKHIFHVVYDKPIKQLPTNPPANPKLLKPKPQPSKNLLLNHTYIPKQNLFKCNKCQIHFISCSAAFAHSRRCSLAKGDWKCSKCRRTFTKVEKAVHVQQHQFSEKFKVHIVCDKILSKVLCRCPKCELLFDEISFADHVSADCVPKNGLECKTCNFSIHLDSYAKHLRYHRKYNFSNTDFILIDFVDVSCQIDHNIKEEKTDFKHALIYCSTCNCHFYRLKSNKRFHLEGRCDRLKNRCCTICGLTFSLKPFNTHMKYDHETLNLKLNDYKFLRVQDLKPINPVMPNFFQCSHCDVHFLSPIHKLDHSCSKLAFEKCLKCSKKYCTASYGIHLAFHNYGRSKTHDKSVSRTRLQFYSCISCNYGFHSYDNVVEHCQKHYNNSEELVTTPCNLCKLHYAVPHSNIHSIRDYFEILEFDYDKLLTDDWMAGFGSLSQDVVDNILSKSIYGTMRNIRLELLVEGPSERTMYRCVQCELNFDQDYVLDHTMETCAASPRFTCNSCSAVFKSRLAKNKHMNVHVIYGDDITFREIVFNNENDKELNEALRSGRQKESLKFRKCQKCKLLIKKSDYDSHISAHDNIKEIETSNSTNGIRVESKQFTFRGTSDSINYKLFKPANASGKPYTIYKCKSCQGCIIKKVNLVRHRCLPSSRYEKCKKCSLQFFVSNLKKHEERHALIPKFTSKNIAVIEFQLLNEIESAVKKRRRYSSDDDASTGAGVNVTVSKTYDTRKVVGRPYSDNLSEVSQDNTDDSSAEETPNAYAKKYIKKSCVEIDNDNESEASQNVIECTPGKKKDLSDSMFDIEKWKMEMMNKLYQCERCYMCFSHCKLLVSHLLKCDLLTSLSETPLICDQCDMVFHPSLISFHEKLHDLVNQNPIENYFYLINISTNGVHTNIKERWLYKCQSCDIYYLSIRTLERHYSFNHVVSDCVRCEICGLQFTKLSRSRHMRIQHEEGNCSKDDLHIEISHKKIVGLGVIRLRPFDKSVVRCNKWDVEIDSQDNHDEQSNNGSINGEDSMDIEKSVAYSDATDVNCEEFENDTVLNESDSVNHVLYKCNVCHRHYLYKRTLARHNMNANHKMRPVQCDLCGLNFSKRTLKIHKSIQHVKLKLSLEDFVITELKDNIITRDSSNTADINESDASLDGSLSLNKEQNACIPEDLKEISKQLKIGPHPINNHIYKCVECSVFYINRRTLLLHIIIKKHKQIGHLRCDLCGLMFGKGSLPKHKKVQHGILNLTRKDFIITDVFGSRLLDDEDSTQSDIKYASSINTDDLPLIELGDKAFDSESKEVKNEKKLKVFRMYQCKDCKICIKKTERNLHVCCSDIQKKQCIRCCLYFRSTDVLPHKRLHIKYPELSRKNFVLVRFGCRTAKNHNIYKCVICSTHFVSLNAFEWHMKALNHQTKRDYCKKCGLFFGKFSLSRHIYIHHTKLNLTVEGLNIIYVSDKNPYHMEDKKENKNLNISNNTPVSEIEATPNVKTVKKLFKCVECDVYFLTRASYYHHIYKHRKLDATEYIDCNICDFQFLNESLGLHMKTHKDKSFCLDKLIIEEYQPNSTELPKIEFYFAKDGLNSKLVSTTTSFDNDDENMLSETGEQLSVIDSTSDELPKSRPGEVNSVVANSFPHNTESGEEGSLNPTAEMPNSDISVKLSD